ncbi:MAG: tRNA (guanosine(46)-N7)-methyltransferase TrmB [Alphaproteobacteria bacterium]|nr:tRNA (guanosine(46)-N7)-methyltransferase TrmB [Alphaproteobacteria bacterium]
MADIWPKVSLELPEQAMINPDDLFSPPLKSLWVEIGFGGGEHLAAQAIRHPDVGFVGCEPFVNGVATLVLQIQEQSLQNIRIVKDDARLLLARLPDQSVGAFFVLFPDPWPKKRHNKRRIIQDASVDAFTRILKPGGSLTMATDDADYALWMQDVMSRHPEFELVLESRTTIYERPENWPITRYEQKGIACGRAPVYLVYRVKKQ